MKEKLILHGSDGKVYTFSGVEGVRFEVEKRFDGGWGRESPFSVLDGHRLTPVVRPYELWVHINARVDNATVSWEDQTTTPSQPTSTPPYMPPEEWQ